MARRRQPLGGKALSESANRIEPEDVEKIRRSSLFSTLSEEDFRRTLSATRCEMWRKGQPLFFEGDVAKAFYIILEGWVLLVRDKRDGSRTVIKLLGPGESFAEVLIAENQRYPVSAEAASELRVARFDCAAFRAKIMDNPALGLAMIAATFRHMHRLLDQLDHLKSWPAEKRVAKMLLDLCGGGDEPCEFTLPVDQALIAARLAVTPHTMSRILRKLLKCGVVAKYGRITIKNKSHLSQFVNEYSAAELP